MMLQYIVSTVGHEGPDKEERYASRKEKNAPKKKAVTKKKTAAKK
jgi:hypothetical protein